MGQLNVIVKNKNGDDIAVEFSRLLVKSYECSKCGKQIFVGKAKSGEEINMVVDSEGNYSIHDC